MVNQFLDVCDCKQAKRYCVIKKMIYTQGDSYNNNKNTEKKIS